MSHVENSRLVEYFGAKSLLNLFDMLTISKYELSIIPGISGEKKQSKKKKSSVSQILDIFKI